MKRWIGIGSAVFVSLAMIVVGILVMTRGPAPPVAAAPSAPPQLAVAHLAPFAGDPNTAVTVTVNASPVITDFEYGETSQGYVGLPSAGSYVVGLVPAGSSDPVLTKTIVLTDDTSYTAVAVGGAKSQDLDILLLEDDNSAPVAGKAKVRIGHLAPFASAITDTLADVRTQAGALVDPALDGVPFGVVAGYLELDAGEYDLKITNDDGDVTLIDLYPATFNDGDVVSVFATGDGGNQPLGAFAMYNSPADTFLPLAASLQVAHLAPFAPGSGTAVTVTLESTPVLTDFVFAESTGYLPIMAGVDQELGIIPAGAMDPVLTATVNLTQAMDFTALAAGDNANQPLELLLLADDNSPPVSGFAKVRVGHLAPFGDTYTNTLADVRAQNGDLVLGNISYGEIVDYVLLPGGQEYDLKITTPGGDVTLIDIMPVTLNNGDILSVFAVGEGANQPLGVFALPPGMEGALMPLAASLQVAHLAPFPMSSTTGVTVTLDGSSVLTNVVYGVSTGYLPVMAGVDYEVGLVPGGSGSPVLTTTINLTHAKEFAAIAYGGAKMWDLDLMLLMNDPTAPMSGSAKVRIGHLAPFAEAITDTLADVRTQAGALVDPSLDDVPFGAVAGYLDLPADKYDLKITNADNTATLIDLFPVTFNDGDNLTVFAVGDGTNQPVGAYALPIGQPGFMLPLAQYTYMPLIFKNAP